MRETKFHTHTKQQAKLQFCISWSLYFWKTNWKTKNSAPKDIRRPHSSIRHEILLKLDIIVIIIIIIIISSSSSIQPLGRSGHRPEFSQVTGMALVRCILGKFLGVVCHCFLPLFRCSHFSPPGASTSATTWEIPAAEVGTVGENVVRQFYRNDDFHAI